MTGLGLKLSTSVRDEQEDARALMVRQGIACAASGDATRSDTPPE
jgi:hypothetical protein